MSRPFVLPDLGEGLVEAEIVRVFVKDGEVVAEDAPLLEVETDKAQVEIPSPMAGRIEKVHVAAHQTGRVGEVLVPFADTGTVERQPAAAPPASPAPATPAPARAPAAPSSPPSPPMSPTRDGPVPAAPAT